MSSSATTSDDKQKASKTKFVVFGGILALGILAAVLLGNVGNQNLNAVAQTNADGQADSSSQTGMYPKDGHWNGSNSFYPYHNPSTLSTSGMATTKVKPDKFSVTVGVETNGTTAEEASSRNAELMSKVIEALKSLGVKDNEISTSNYNVYPVYEYRQPAKICPEIYPQPPYCLPGNVLTGYRASNSATITLDAAGDVDAGKVIDSTVKAGANNVNGVYFFISQDRQQEIRDDLIKDAIANAKHRAQIAANALEMSITGVQSVSLNDVYFPIFYGKNYYGGAMASDSSAPTQIMPGEQDISTTVSVVFYMGNIMTTTGDNSTSSSGSPSGMTSTKDNTNCTNPPGGPMIC